MIEENQQIEEEIIKTPDEEVEDMAKSFDDDDDFDKFKPGTIDVDDLFGSSDEPFEENEVEVGTVNNAESTEDYSDYTFDSNDNPVKVVNDEEDVDDLFNFNKSDETTMVDEEEHPESFEKPEIDNKPELTDEKIEDKPSESDEKESYEDDAVTAEQLTNEKETATVEEDSEEKILEDLVDDGMKAVEGESVPKEETSEPVEEKTEEVEIKDVGFEEDTESEIDAPNTEPVKIEEEEAIDMTPPTEEIHEESTEEVKEESKEEKFETEKLEKAVEEMDKQETKQEEPNLSPEEKEYFSTEADGSLADYIKKSFKKRVAEIQSTFTENALVNYLEGYSSKEDRKLIQEQYCFEYGRYYKYVDFKNPAAKAALWILVAGEFAELIERKKFNGEIQPVVETSNAGDDPNNIEDENITAIKEKRRKEAAEQSKYGIDRVVWDIDDNIAEENTSIFDEQKDLFSEFKKTEFYGILTQVLESTRIADMSQVRCKVSIKESCGYYPIIDFSTGIRVICIDTEDSSQYNNHPLLFNRKLPFQFKVPKHGIKTRIIYSDICRECAIATVFALKKLIAFDYIKPRYKINIANNYVISYTTEQMYLDMFEKGDPDSKRPGSSTYYSPKPATNFVGVVVLDKKTEKDIKSVHRNQIYKDLNRMPDISVDNYDPQFILSARYIRNDLRLRNPTIPANQRFVEYIITQYTECNSVIINDGIQVVCACIIKEHRLNYGPGTPYSISFEFDRDNLLTPAVVRMLDNHDGFELSMIKKCQPLECMQTFILPPSRRKLDGVLPSEKGRLDVRYFSPQGIQSRYREQRDLWSRYDLTTQQGRNEFIKSRGFEVFISPKYMTFDIMPECLMNIENGNVIRNIQKISITALSDRNSDDTINLLNKQKEMEYYKTLDQSELGTFQKFLINATNIMLDFLGQNN
jgi:hypothetical protein